MEKFLRDLKNIASERIGSAVESIKLEWSYYAQRANIWRQYKEVIPDADEAGYSRASEQLHHIDGEEQLLAVIETQRIQLMARRYGFKMPDLSQDENYGSVQVEIDEGQPKYLTAVGFQLLREQLRMAKKERREAAGFWFGIFVGAIGAVTGLAAVLR